MTDIKFPCNNCICVAVCRHKLYSDTLRDCSLIRDFIGKHAQTINGHLYITIDHINKQLSHFRSMLQSYLNPTRWEVNSEGLFITYTQKGIIKEDHNEFPVP